MVQKQVKLPELQFRTALNGVIQQDKDYKTETVADFESVTTKEPTEQEKNDMVFANILVKHTKSNTIVLAKDNRLISSEIGRASCRERV